MTLQNHTPLLRYYHTVSVRSSNSKGCHQSVTPQKQTSQQQHGCPAPAVSVHAALSWVCISPASTHPVWHSPDALYSLVARPPKHAACQPVDNTNPYITRCFQRWNEKRNAQAAAHVTSTRPQSTQAHTCYMCTKGSIGYVGAQRKAGMSSLGPSKCQVLLKTWTRPAGHSSGSWLCSWRRP